MPSLPVRSNALMNMGGIGVSSGHQLLNAQMGSLDWIITLCLVFDDSL